MSSYYINKLLLKNKLFKVVYLLLFVFLFGIIKVEANSLADGSHEGSVGASVNVPASCTLDATINSEHSATLPNGIYSGGSSYYPNGIGNTSIDILCNFSGGFSLYAIGFTNDEYGSNFLIGNDSNEHLIMTGTATSGSTSAWSMKAMNPVNATINSGFGDYSEIPDAYSLIASHASTTSGSIEASLETTYAAFISRTQSTDSYRGQVKFVLVYPDSAPAPVAPISIDDCPADSICYVPNSGDIVGSMSSISDVYIQKSATAGVQTAYSNSEVTLIAPNYSRAGYGFAGWSPDFQADDNSTIYGPNETIITEDLAAHGMVLYPVWIASAGTMQSWNGCDDLDSARYDPYDGSLIAGLSNMTALTDLRDNNTYAIAKLTDGYCWMVENLKLEAENSTNAALAQGYGGIFSRLDSSENQNFTKTTNPTPNNLYNSSNITGSDGGYRVPRYNNSNHNDQLTPNYLGGSDYIRYSWYAYGNYYTWAAAIANTYTYPYNDTVDADWTSICPAGWSLPSGHTSQGPIDTNTQNTHRKSFSYLDRTMGGSGGDGSTNSPTGQSMTTYWRKFPNNFLYAGYIYNSSAEARGTVGTYWSRTPYDTNSSRVLYLDNYSLSPIGTYNEKSHGFNIRCIFGNLP